jgi:hypothetical protein
MLISADTHYKLRWQPPPRLTSCKYASICVRLADLCNITEAAPPVSARRRQHLMCSKLDLPAGSSGRRACKYFIRELLGPSLFASVTGRGRKLRRRRKHTTLVLSAGCNLSPRRRRSAPSSPSCC